MTGAPPEMLLGRPQCRARELETVIIVSRCKTSNLQLLDRFAEGRGGLSEVDRACAEASALLVTLSISTLLQSYQQYVTDPQG